MEANNNLAAALIAAQSEFPKPQKNARANYGSYSDITEILSVLRPVLNRHGLFLGQRVKQADAGLIVETFVLHSSGESLSFGEMFMPVTAQKGNLAQGYGSAETYARRYSLCAAFGLEADDDDAQSLGSSAPVQPREQVTLSEKDMANAEAAASEGLAAYEAYFKAITKEQRRALIGSGVHAELKDKATKAGA